MLPNTPKPSLQSPTSATIKKKSKKQKQYSFPYTSPQLQIPIDKVLCKICEQFLTSPIDIECGHTFCQYCLFQYFLVEKYCPVCQKSIVGCNFTKNDKLGKIVQEFCRFLGNGAIKRYQYRNHVIKCYRRLRKVDNFQVGVPMDICNPQYIWKRGRLIRIIQKGPIYQVLYEETQQTACYITKMRFAKLGFYTNRKDITIHVPLTRHEYKDQQIQNSQSKPQKIMKEVSQINSQHDDKKQVNDTIVDIKEEYNNKQKKIDKKVSQKQQQNTNKQQSAQVSSQNC